MPRLRRRINTHCDAYYGLIDLTLKLFKETVLLGVEAGDGKWAGDEYFVHHVREMAVVSLRDIPDDRDGVADGNVMAEEACG